MQDINPRPIIRDFVGVNPRSFEYAITSRPNVNDPTTWDWRPAIQAALDWMIDKPFYKKLVINERLGVSLNPLAPSHPNAYSAGAVALSIKRSGITIGGGGAVYLLSGQGSGEGAIFGNPDVVALSDITFDDIEIDGNDANTNGLISGILMVGCTRPKVTERTLCHNLSRHGIMFRANSSQTGFGPVDVQIGACTVRDVGGIGIQATRCDGFTLGPANIQRCGDNGWDVFGNDPTDVNGSLARRVRIGDVYVQEAQTGGFVESFSDCEVHGTVYGGNGGYKTNRINSGARRVSFRVKVSCTGFPTEGRAYGIQIANNSGLTTIFPSEFEGLKQAVLSGSGCDRTYLMSGQALRDIRNYVWQYRTGTNTLVRCLIGDQILDATAISASGWPQLCPPNDHPWFSSARFQSTVGKLFLIANKTEIPSDFTQSTAVLTSPGAWGGAFSLFNIGSDGRTRINTSPDINVTNRPIVVIEGQAYELSASGVAGEYYIATWDGTTATHGDFRSSLNSALTLLVKYEGFKSPLHSDQSFASTRTLLSVAGWGPAFSTFVSGDTLVSMSGTQIAENTIAVINGYSYRLNFSGTADQYTARRLDNITPTPGNWTAYITSGHIAYLQ